MNLIHYLKDEWRAYTLGGVLLLMTTGAALSIPWTLKQIISVSKLTPLRWPCSPFGWLGGG